MTRAFAGCSSLCQVRHRLTGGGRTIRTIDSRFFVPATSGYRQIGDLVKKIILLFTRRMPGNRLSQSDNIPAWWLKGTPTSMSCWTWTARFLSSIRLADIGSSFALRASRRRRRSLTAWTIRSRCMGPRVTAWWALITHMALVTAVVVGRMTTGTGSNRYRLTPTETPRACWKTFGKLSTRSFGTRE